MFEPLNLPPCEFRMLADGSAIFDALRGRYVKLTPEEWVRQHFAQYLIRDRGFPASLLGLEISFTYGQVQRRADIIAYDRAGKPLVMVECKAPQVDAGQRTFDQVVRYNMAIRAPYVVLTNGLVHYCCRVDTDTGAYTFLDDMPRFEAICQG